MGNALFQLMVTFSFSALVYAVREQLLEISLLLLSRGAFVNQTTKSGDTSMHLAAALPNIAILSLLVKNKGNVIARNKEGRK
jgi:ankyrin repeat protein